MNIKQAKTQIKNAITAYFTKDEFGKYIIPIERQRPVFLIGPPGVGKTAVMEQIAQELGVGLVAYSMTHHTRQSAIGLPFITKKTYGGREYDVSEYTMSEIIASVYDMTAETGLAEGILFLDEINCVSETLNPAMLQFLQYKTFGRHRVPDGWIVVTAGNPPEYNNSVREFDTVTWDRLKRVDIEPDYGVWKEYAYKKGVHPAVTTYLGIKSDNFYKMETTVDGKSFVTARGWVDLSDMMLLYERHGITVDENLTAQYLQNKKIAKDFAICYDLWNKYRSDYQVDDILDGKASDEIKSRAQAAKFDERLALIGLILDRVTAEARVISEREETAKTLAASLSAVRTALALPGADTATELANAAAGLAAKVETGEKASSVSSEAIRAMKRAAEELGKMAAKIAKAASPDGKAAFKLIKAELEQYTAEIKKDAKAVTAHLDNVFAFSEEVFPDGQEMLILVTELTTGYYTARHISRYGCEAYFKHNKELLFHERQMEIIAQLAELEDV
ncbi:MAG: MoxR family ATPase [Clostridiales bacterium]|jgi:hypothetical protein|nr:MoxR family ATPase [Clostridiales bacterium]